jgi:hypothetical protein
MVLYDPTYIDILLSLIRGIKEVHQMKKILVLDELAEVRNEFRDNGGDYFECPEIVGIYTDGTKGRETREQVETLLRSVEYAAILLPRDLGWDLQRTDETGRRGDFRSDGAILTNKLKLGEYGPVNQTTPVFTMTYVDSAMPGTEGWLKKNAVDALDLMKKYLVN